MPTINLRTDKAAHPVYFERFIPNLYYLLTKTNAIILVQVDEDGDYLSHEISEPKLIKPQAATKAEPKPKPPKEPQKVFKMGTPPPLPHQQYKPLAPAELSEVKTERAEYLIGLGLSNGYIAIKLSCKPYQVDKVRQRLLGTLPQLPPPPKEKPILEPQKGKLVIIWG